MSAKADKISLTGVAFGLILGMGYLGRESIEDPSLLDKTIPRDKPPISSEISVTRFEVKFAASSGELEMKWLCTQRVKLVGERSALQTQTEYTIPELMATGLCMVSRLLITQKNQLRRRTPEEAPRMMKAGA